MGNPTAAILCDAVSATGVAQSPPTPASAPLSDVAVVKAKEMHLELKSLGWATPTCDSPPAVSVPRVLLYPPLGRPPPPPPLRATRAPPPPPTALLSVLPVRLLFPVFLYLDLESLGWSTQTSVAFAEAAHADELWRIMYSELTSHPDTIFGRLRPPGALGE